MVVSRVGPWRTEDYESFVALATDPPPKPLTLNALMSLSRFEPSQPEQWTLKTLDFVNEALSIRRKHPVYKWLQKNQDFRAAWGAFDRVRKRSAGKTGSAKLVSPTAELVFLREFVRYAGWAYMWGKRSKPSNYGANADRRRAAAKCANALAQLITEGISLRSYSDTQRLKSMLSLNMGEYVNAAEIYMRLALKAQSQCRATLETLAAIKNPAPVTFVKQANVAHGPQQVNNGPQPPAEASRARETENQRSKLLEQQNGKRLDGGTMHAAVGADTELAAVGEVHGTENADW